MRREIQNTRNDMTRDMKGYEEYERKHDKSIFPGFS